MRSTSWATPRAGLGACVLVIAVSGCGLSVESTNKGPAPTSASVKGSPATPGVSASLPSTSVPDGESTPSSGPAGPTVPGYAYGAFPAVPMFDLPDLSMLDAALSGFSIKVQGNIGSIPGVTVRPARCDSSGNIDLSGGALTLYGDGSGRLMSADGVIRNYGDGSGTYLLNGTKVVVYGDGSGSYNKGQVSIRSYGDGSGNYADGSVAIHLYGDGSGNYARGSESIVNYGDGSAYYADQKVRIRNFGDGSGNYEDGTITITNYGDGTGSVNGVSARLDPIPPVPPLGKFPTMGAIKPIKSCGTRIIIDDSVLFDFEKSDLRPAAAANLNTLAQALNTIGVRSADVQGHTDAMGTDSYNQGLSERRAASVAAALKSAGLTATLTEHGYGEKYPVAPNTLKGKDNPAGRQLNRRVELVIPSQ